MKKKLAVKRHLPKPVKFQTYSSKEISQKRSTLVLLVLNNSDSGLVLPIWGILSYYGKYSGRLWGSFLSFNYDKPLFITVKDLNKLHQLVPDRTSGVWGTSYAAPEGQINLIHSVVVMSKAGVIFTLFCQGESLTFNVSCKVVREMCVDKELKRKLIQHFKDSRGDVIYSVNPALSHLPFGYLYPERPSK